MCRKNFFAFINTKNSLFVHNSEAWWPKRKKSIFKTQKNAIFSPPSNLPNLAFFGQNRPKMGERDTLCFYQKSSGTPQKQSSKTGWNRYPNQSFLKMQKNWYPNYSFSKNLETLNQISSLLLPETFKKGVNSG